jgi:hypothetical protein
MWRRTPTRNRAGGPRIPGQRTSAGIDHLAYGPSRQLGQLLGAAYEYQPAWTWFPLPNTHRSLRPPCMLQFFDDGL